MTELKCPECKYLNRCYGVAHWFVRILCPGEAAVDLADRTLPGQKITVESKVPKSAIPSPDKGLPLDKGSPMSASK